LIGTQAGSPERHTDFQVCVSEKLIASGPYLST
jgi:hypothetical protein